MMTEHLGYENTREMLTHILNPTGKEQNNGWPMETHSSYFSHKLPRKNTQVEKNLDQILSAERLWQHSLDALEIKL